MEAGQVANKAGVVKRLAGSTTARTNTLSGWCEKALYIDGKPFTFAGRSHLRRIYDAIAPFVFLMCGRGVEKSTYLGCFSTAMMARFPFFRILYVSASRQQALDFSRDQLEQRLTSPYLRAAHFDPRICDNNAFLKSFLNGSKIRLRHMFNTADRVRGIRADLLEVDEIQDVQYRFMSIAEEVLVQSPFALKRYSGTPKTMDNTAQFYWRQTTQEEWCIKCEHCWRWNDSNEFGPGLGVRNIGQNGLVCKYCDGDIQVSNGKWVAHGSGNESRMLGFRIPQLIIPYYQDAERWQDQILMKLQKYSQAQFYNEVLGYSYDAADKPVSLDEIQRCCKGAWVGSLIDAVPRVPIFAGVDWGSGGMSKTVIVVGAFVSKNVFQVFFAHEFKPVEHPTMDDILREIARICTEWQVVACGVDFGYGPMENQRLRAMIGDDVVWQFQNVNQQRREIMWNAKAGRFQHAVVQTLSQLFTAMKDERMVFPHWKRWEPFAEHILNARKEYNWATGYVSYVNSPDRPDDTLHAINYAYMAARIYVSDWLQREIVIGSKKDDQAPMPHFLSKRRGRPNS